MRVHIIELPRPSLGDLSDLKAFCIRLRRERTPNVLGYTFDELNDLDVVKVELVPEKKGLILKHVEYEVTSQVSILFGRRNKWQIFGKDLTALKNLKRLGNKKRMALLVTIVVCHCRGTKALCCEGTMISMLFKRCYSWDIHTEWYPDCHPRSSWEVNVFFCEMIFCTGEKIIDHWPAGFGCLVDTNFVQILV